MLFLVLFVCFVSDSFRKTIKLLLEWHIILMPCKATSSKPTLCRRAGLPPVNGNCSVLDLCRFSAYLAHFSPLQIVLLGGNLLSLLTWIWVLRESSTCHFLVAHRAVYVELSMLQYLCCTHTNGLSIYLLFFVLFFFFFLSAFVCFVI